MMFSSFEQEVHTRMTKMVEIDQDALTAEVERQFPHRGVSEPLKLTLHPVKSYVASSKTLQNSTFSGFAVPAFAVHWAVLVGGFMYHLAFRNPKHAELELNDLSRHGKPIYFAAHAWEPDRICL